MANWWQKNELGSFKHDSAKNRGIAARDTPLRGPPYPPLTEISKIANRSLHLILMVFDVFNIR